MKTFKAAAERLAAGDHISIGRVPDGFDAVAVADLARAFAADRRKAAIVHVARDGARMASLERELAFFAPEMEVLTFPAWDCLPYDRVSPSAPVIARRMTTLARLVGTRGGDKPRIVLTTANAVTQRVIAPDRMGAQSFSAAPGNAIDLDKLVQWLEINGFSRTATVRDTGEYAVRGGIVDLYPAGLPEPVRLDFFGDTLESIRSFDPETQRTTGTLRALDLVPMSEVVLSSETIPRFRQGYVGLFGAARRDDALYEAVSEGRRYPGVEHWLPLFHTGLATLFDYLPDVPVLLDHQFEDAVRDRLAQVADYYEARLSAQSDGGGPAYNPLPPDRLYLSADELETALAATGVARLSPFEVGGSHDDVEGSSSPSPLAGEGRGGGYPSAPVSRKEIPPSRLALLGESVSPARGERKREAYFDAGARAGRSFAAERAEEGGNVFDAVVAHVEARREEGRRVVLASWSAGSRKRLAGLLADHGLKGTADIATWAEALALPKGKTGLAVLGLEQGFETADVAVISEQDVLGDRLVRPRRKSRRAQDFLTEITSLSTGDLVVHIDHGIGRFVGLQAIEAGGAPHDCLEIHYAGGDKLFLPVENVDLLTRYGSEEMDVALDRLGGAGWQNRKARLKQRIREMAGELVKIAAERALNPAARLTLPEGLYGEFCARFPYEETEDQNAAIDATLADLAAGKPMDRLICGDVGFGKTEVALRAAFATAMNGKQVAVVVPTTLLARQHFKTFQERFRGFPVKVAQASRFVGAAELKEVKAGLAAGTVDIVVGTHALLGKAIKFADLGLVIVDEEQHFGVAHKEKLKQLRAEVHVLTLTATPIPRTLQLAMTGVRDLSIIATPPVDRLAVRTFISPFDPVTIREALLRERYRGGQSFFVCPRIEDIAELRAFLASDVPEVKVAVGHGQMAASELEDVMSAFYDGQYDVLLSTTIVESGLDIPNANTLIVHRADMFGLAQLYQLRGRVGRSKARAYALLTVPAARTMTVGAERRLKVLQSLDSLGAGFQLASHDLDIRGAGNLLGEEQSGHIREVGYELYQQMLEEAVAELKAGKKITVGQWSPAITIGTPVLIPEDYVPDLDLRLGLYRRLANVETDEELQGFSAEFADRFGERPKEVDQLIDFVGIKLLCKRANVEKVDAGPKGVVLAFRDNAFANPDGLIIWLAKKEGDAKLRPDMRLVFRRDWADAAARLKGTTVLLKTLVGIAEGKKKAA